MNAQQKLKHLILIRHEAMCDDFYLPKNVTAENIDELYDSAEDGNYALQDAREEVRCGEEETQLQSPYSRHYESKAVAAKAEDGSWIGWVYWYGGGKHAEPEAIDWIEDAYDLTVTEEEKMVTVRTFAVAPEAA